MVYEALQIPLQTDDEDDAGGEGRLDCGRPPSDTAFADKGYNADHCQLMLFRPRDHGMQ